VISSTVGKEEARRRASRESSGNLAMAAWAPMKKSGEAPRTRAAAFPPSGETFVSPFAAGFFDDHLVVLAEAELHLFSRAYPEPFADRFRQRALSLLGDGIPHGINPYFGSAKYPNAPRAVKSSTADGRVSFR